jgi:hypothetical protein
MRSGQRKNSRSRAKSGTARTKAKTKTRRSSSKELARTAEHVKKNSTKHGQRSRLAATGSVEHAQITICNPVAENDIAALRTPAAANGISDLRSANAGLMSFSPLAMLLRQQELLTSVMLNVMQTQQHWARAFSRLPWRTA